MAEYIRINPADNVAVALHPLGKGLAASIEGVGKVILSEDIPAGHKFALEDLGAGENVIKYGYAIGHVTKNIAAGSLIDHNVLKTNLEGILEYKYEPQKGGIAEGNTGKCVCGKPGEVRNSDATSLNNAARNTFKGFRRASGEVGIRNQIWIIPTVGCVNGTVEKLAQLFREEMSGKMGSVDAIVAFPHNYGCSQLGDDHQNTKKILRDMVLHPNAGGVLVVGLGCENNQLTAFKEFLSEKTDIDNSRIKMMETQKIDGDEIEYGLGLLRDIFDVCSKDAREEVPVSELRIGLKCGGSDGLSGITANPMLGIVSDWLVSKGGTTILTEVPEMFGAETILMNRCRDKATFDKTVLLINDFKSYFIKNEQPIYENPSPGNKAGGISTLEEKSLGCTQKCGTSAVCGVLKYGERLSGHGLNLLSAPGNDLVASTALASAGCQIVLFTTGRGTPFGTFVPTLKVSTNTALFVKKPLWIDFNAGIIADYADAMHDAAEKFIDYVLSVVNGEPVNNERAGFREIAIFKSGVTL